MIVKSNGHITVLTEYWKGAEQIKDIITKHWHILESDFQINGVFKDLPLMVY